MPYSQMIVPLCWSLLWGGLCLGLVVAKVPAATRRVGLAALACALHALALLLPPWESLAATLGFGPATGSSSPFNTLNWTGKAVALLLSGLYAYGWRWVTPAAVGLRRPQPASLRVVGPVVVAVALGIFANAYALRQTFLPLWWHEGLYYSLVPGIEEELFYRGVLLGLLGPAFARTIPLPGTRTSWGGLVTVLLFGLGHVLKITPVYYVVNDLLLGGHGAVRIPWWYPLLYFSPLEAVYPLAMGLLFLWVRERTGSVWAAAAAHCLLNTALTAGRMLG